MNILLPPGWLATPADLGSQLLHELRLETIAGHVLYSIDITVVGHCEGSDDILVQHVGNPERVTVVHLTWSMKPEINTVHPTVEYDGDVAGFLAYERRSAAV
jgi:hypothetical protein